jgi:signal transduction histidine kinase
MTVNAQDIRAEAHITLSKVIQRDASIVIERWTRRALQEQPNAPRLHLQTLLDHLPFFLQELAQCLAESDNSESTKKWWAARRHGEQRWQNGWSLTEMIQDYQILRLILVDYLEEVLDRPLRSREIMAIGLALDEAISASVNSYVREGQERAEKADLALRQQAELLKLANRRKDEFLAILGHELRNPLGPIRNAVDLLALKSGDQTTVEWVRGLLSRQVRLMTRLVDDLLDASRIARRKITLEKERIDLTKLTRTVTEDFRASLAETGPTITMELPAQPIWVDGDNTRLTQVIGNLLQNATKFTDKLGQVTIQAIQDSAHATLIVRDTGIGIEPDLLGHVFDSFMQVDRTVERSRGGLGLGLALVKGLVELHGGTVTALSEGVGKGAEFRVKLPVAESPAACLDTAPPLPITSSPMRILLIEDHRDSANCLKALLELAGHQVVVAYTGGDGIAVAKQHPPDVVLSDLGLPGMNGYDVATTLRGQPETSKVILIAISGYGSDTDLAHCRQVGFDHHMTKPIDPTKLKELLAKVATESR